MTNKRGKTVKCKKHIYMTFFFIQFLLSSKWIIFLPMFPLIFSKNSCDRMRLISPNILFSRNKKGKILKMSPLELVPTVQKKALAKLLHCLSPLAFWALIPSFIFPQVEQEVFVSPQPQCCPCVPRGKRLIFKVMVEQSYYVQSLYWFLWALRMLAGKYERIDIFFHRQT